MSQISTRQQLLQLLQDGSFHSGESLAKQLGISRAAIWKQVQALQALGVDFYAVRGKGYRLGGHYELLDLKQIENHLNQHTLQTLTIDVFDEVASTNDYCLDKLSSEGSALCPHLCIAEQQSNGRGRRGRKWITPYGGSVACSLLWQFDCPPNQLSGLSLVVGIALVKTLHAMGAESLQLKWPNDIMYEDYKLGGILIEIISEASGPSYVVIGIGINIKLGDNHRLGMHEVSQPWVDLSTVMHGQKISRNILIAALTDRLIGELPEFERNGFSAYTDEWHQYDALINREVVVLENHQHKSGIANGVNDAGSLILRCGHEQTTVMSGDVSVRLQ